jgi:flagellar FliL protein
MANAPAAAAPVAEEEVAEATATSGGKKKKLIMIGAAVLLLAAAGGGGWFFFGKSKPAGPGAPAQAAAKPASKKTPIFIPLEAFTVNLADDDADRYAQIAITLQISDSKVDERLKVMMPVVRNRILMILADKTSRQLVTREGKEKLAAEIMFDTGRSIGWEPPKAAPAPAPVPAEPVQKAEGAEGAAAEAAPAAPVAAPVPEAPVGEPNPIEEVHFAQFIIQ